MNLLLGAVAVCVGLVFGHASPSLADEGPGACQAKMTAFPLDISSKCCTHASKSKGGPTEILYQHPWAAVLNYKIEKTGLSKRFCSGTLISGRYVLTAAHCITGRVLDIGTPTTVSFGKYDFNHEGKDCKSAEGGGEECNDGATSIEIETMIPHPKYYNPEHPSRWNDIGLIRLKEVAPYTDFIRPICLPTKNPETSLPPSHPLYAVGWSNEQNVKVLYKVPFVNLETCKPIYNTSRRNAVLGEAQLCAGGIEGMDPCKGDGGGPLVYENKDGLSELIGTVSFGPVPCGQKDIPSVYSNVYEHLDWIKTIIVA